jgi:hypothetical protein
MSEMYPQRRVRGYCPNCGPSWITVLEEGASYFIGLSTPNWYCTHWVGQCSDCHAYLETSFDDDRTDKKQEWTLVDDEKIEFLFGNPPRLQTDPQTHPLGDSELNA